MFSFRIYDRQLCKTTPLHAIISDESDLLSTNDVKLFDTLQCRMFDEKLHAFNLTTYLFMKQTAEMTEYFLRTNKLIFSDAFSGYPV